MLQASAHDDFCTWRSLWEAENWPRKLVGGPMVPWYIVCASPQNTSVKSVGHCQLVSSWESSGCVGFPFSALALMWAGILGGRVGRPGRWELYMCVCVPFFQCEYVSGPLYSGIHKYTYRYRYRYTCMYIYLYSYYIYIFIYLVIIYICIYSYYIYSYIYI